MSIKSALRFTPEEVLGVYSGADYLDEASVGDSVGLFGIEAAYRNAIEQTVSEENFEVIHAHDWLTFRAGIAAKEISGQPLIVHVHSVESDRAGGKPGNPLVHEIEALGLQNADQIIAVSEFTKHKIVKEYFIPPSKITVVHNSIDPGMISPLGGDNSYRYLQKMQKEGYKIVVNVGRLTIQKGLTNFLRSAQKVVEYHPKTLFLIVGSGDQEYELIHLSAELGIGRNVLFAGFQRGKTWRDAFDIADLFVMPSVAEPFGLTPLEAAAYNTPSLISKQSGVAEVLHNCLKVDCWDIDSMANQMIGFLRSDSLSETMINNLGDEFRSLDWAKSAEKLLGIYKKQLSQEAKL